MILHPFIPFVFGTTPGTKLQAEKRANDTPMIFKNQRSVSTLLPLNKLEIVLRNCETAARIAESSKSVQPSHDDGNFLLSILMRFEKGVQWFCENITGWGKTEKDMYQIDHFVKNGYVFTCAKTQEKKICPFTTEEYCLRSQFDRNGRRTSPSPIRFAYGAKSLRSIFKGEAHGK